ncbi:hypothetical protein Tco_0060442, partial [Tanacetum coccineum]
MGDSFQRVYVENMGILALLKTKQSGKTGVKTGCYVGEILNCGQWTIRSAVLLVKHKGMSSSGDPMNGYERLSMHDMTPEGGCSKDFRKKLKEFIEKYAVKLEITMGALQPHVGELNDEESEILETVAQSISAILAVDQKCISIEFCSGRKLEAKKKVEFITIHSDWGCSIILNWSGSCSIRVLTFEPLALSSNQSSVKLNISAKPDISKASSAGGKLHILKPSCERNGITPTLKESLSPTSGSKDVRGDPDSGIGGHWRSSDSGMVKLEIRGNVNFEIKSQFMRELREDTFSRNKNDDAHEHVERVLDIVSLFNIPGVSHDAVMLRVFPITLTGAAKRWVDKLPLGTVDSWDLLKTTFIQ